MWQQQYYFQELCQELKKNLTQLDKHIQSDINTIANRLKRQELYVMWWNCDTEVVKAGKQMRFAQLGLKSSILFF